MSQVSRDIKDCDPILREAYLYGVAQYKRVYPTLPPPFVICTHRSSRVQDAYFAQGRKPLTAINALRKLAELPPIGEAEGKLIITKKKSGSSKHELLPAKAFDIAFANGKTLLKNPQYFRNFAKLVRAKFPQVAWGGDWDGDGSSADETFIDMPHFQI